MLRLYEAHGARGTARRPARRSRSTSARLANVLEDDGDAARRRRRRRSALPYRPHQILTVKAAMTPHVVCVGLATLDTILAVPRHPAPEDRVVATDHAVAGGGPAATAAVTLARLGVHVVFVGAVGDDQAGAAIRTGLERRGRRRLRARDDPRARRSPQSSILVGDGTRAIVAYRAAPPPLELSDRARRRSAADAAWVHVDHVGYRAAPRDGAALGRRRQPDRRARPRRRRALRADRARADASTSAAAGGARRRRGARRRDARRRRAAPPYTRDGDDDRGARVRRSTVVSTLGAGDVFHGALLAQLVRERAARRTRSRAANLAAASPAARSTGARRSRPGRARRRSAECTHASR